jgi:hypothetical protein
MARGLDTEGDGIVSLVKETADGLSRLVADHIRLARTEMVADLKSYARGLGVTAAAAALLGLGYGLGCVAGALALATVVGGPLAFAAVAGFHLLVGGIALAVGLRRLRAERPLQETAAEVSRTVAVLTAETAVGARRIAGHAP